MALPLAKIKSAKTTDNIKLHIRQVGQVGYLANTIWWLFVVVIFKAESVCVCICGCVLLYVVVLFVRPSVFLITGFGVVLVTCAKGFFHALFLRAALVFCFLFSNFIFYPFHCN